MVLTVIELAPLAVKFVNSPLALMSWRDFWIVILGMCTGSKGGKFDSGMPAKFIYNTHIL